jgi:DNA-nicking Smr family endonuclease
VQREIVRSLLAGIPWVVDYADADPGGGGWGATLVSLSPPAD